MLERIKKIKDVLRINLEDRNPLEKESKLFSDLHVVVARHKREVGSGKLSTILNKTLALLREAEAVVASRENILADQKQTASAKKEAHGFFASLMKPAIDINTNQGKITITPAALLTDPAFAKTHKVVKELFKEQYAAENWEFITKLYDLQMQGKVHPNELKKIVSEYIGDGDPRGQKINLSAEIYNDLLNKSRGDKLSLEVLNLQ